MFSNHSNGTHSTRDNSMAIAKHAYGRYWCCLRVWGACGEEGKKTPNELECLWFPFVFTLITSTLVLRNSHFVNSHHLPQPRACFFVGGGFGSVSVSYAISNDFVLMKRNDDNYSKCLKNIANRQTSGILEQMTVHFHAVFFVWRKQLFFLLLL